MQYADEGLGYHPVGNFQLEENYFYFDYSTACQGTIIDKLLKQSIQLTAKDLYL